jgi:hypothetical protein
MNTRDRARNERALDRVGRGLRNAYQPVVTEPVPPALEDLARRLEEPGDEGNQPASRWRPLRWREIPWREIPWLAKLKRRDWHSLGWIIPTAGAIGFVAGQIVRFLA